MANELREAFLRERATATKIKSPEGDPELHLEVRGVRVFPNPSTGRSRHFVQILQGTEPVTDIVEVPLGSAKELVNAIDRVVTLLEEERERFRDEEFRGEGR